MAQRGQLIYQVVRTGSDSIWNIRNNIGDSHAQILGKLLISIIQILPWAAQAGIVQFADLPPHRHRDLLHETYDNTSLAPQSNVWSLNKSYQHPYLLIFPHLPQSPQDVQSHHGERELAYVDLE